MFGISFLCLFSDLGTELKLRHHLPMPGSTDSCLLRDRLPQEYGLVGTSFSDTAVVRTNPVKMMN